MSEQETVTFTWTTADGQSFEVLPCTRVDEWTGRELRAVERINGGAIGGLSTTSLGGLVYAVSAARVVPGLTIDQADAEITVGRIREIMRQLNERYAAASAAAEPEVPPAVEVEHLTPTNAGSEA